MIDVCGGGQVFYWFDVIFGVEYCVEVSYFDGIFIVGCVFSGFSLFGIQLDGIGVKMQFQYWFVKDVYFYVVVMLFVVEVVIVSGIGNGVWFFDFKQCQ